jgi:hypothetical protein
MIQAVLHYPLDEAATPPPACPQSFWFCILSQVTLIHAPDSCHIVNATRKDRQPRICTKDLGPGNADRNGGETSNDNATRPREGRGAYN